MVKSSLFIDYVVFAVAFLQLGSVFGQSVFYGNSFLCDERNNNLDCNYGDNIICDTDKLCTVTCNDNCNGIIINARNAKSLFIKNIVNGDNLRVYCPQNGPYGIDNNCIMEIANNVNDVQIFAQESFHDFSLIQSPLNDKTFNMYSSTIHCGDLLMVEFQCLLNYFGNSCQNHDQKCQNYRIPTPSPTYIPTIVTSLPTLSPTIKPSTNPTLPTSPSLNQNDDNLVTETTKLREIIATKESSFGNNSNVEKSESDGLFGGDNDLHYVLLILGLCIVWGSFFCCFVALYYHREKKALRKTVTIISRPMSPSLGVLYKQTQQPLDGPYSNNPQPPNANAIHHTLDINMNEGSTLEIEDNISSQKPYQDRRFSMDSTMAKQMQLQQQKTQQTEIQPNELYKVSSLPRQIRLSIDKHKEDEECKVDGDEKSILIAPGSPGDTKSPKYQISPRPYVIDKKQVVIINDEYPSSPISPKVGQLPTLNADAHSNPISINTSQAVDIQLPYGSEVGHEQEQKESMEIRPSTPNTIDVDHIDIKDDEGSFDSRYYQNVTRMNSRDISNENDNMNVSLPVSMNSRHINNKQFGNQLQAEGNNHNNNNTKKRKFNSVSFRDNKLSVDGSSNYSVQSSTIPPPPPPPPPSLMIGNPKDHAAIHGANIINNNNHNNHHLLSPSRHYRIQYSLGIQQDISNAMSVPGASSGRKFLFGSEDSSQRTRAQSLSQNSLLKPPSASQRFGHSPPSNPIQTDDKNEYEYDQQSAQPQVVYLSCPKK